MGGRRIKVTRMKQRKKGDMSNKRMHMCVYRQSATFKNESKLCFCVCKPTQVLTFLDVNVEFKKGKEDSKCVRTVVYFTSAPLSCFNQSYTLFETHHTRQTIPSIVLLDMYTCIQISRKIPQVLRIRKVNTQEFCF